MAEGADATAGESESLIAALRHSLPHSLGSNLWRANRGGDLPSSVVDWRLTAVVIPALLLISLGLLWYPPTRELKYRQLVMLQVWGSGFLWFVTWLGWLTKDAVVDLFERELAPALSAETKARAAALVKAWGKRRRRLLPAVAATVVGAGTAGTAIAYDLNWFTQPPADPLLALAFAVWLASYALVFLLAIRLGLATTFYGDIVRAFHLRDLQSHPLTPEQEPAIRSTLRVGSEMLGLALATALYQTTLVLWLRDLDWFLFVHLSVTLLASIGTGVVLYGQVNRRLVNLIEDRRALILSQVEAELWPLLIAAPGGAPPDAEALKRLSALHQQVLARDPGLGWRERFKLALPALPPLLALANNKPFAEALQALFAAWLH